MLRFILRCNINHFNAFAECMLDPSLQTINLVPQDTPRQIDLFTDVKQIDKYERLDMCIEDIRRYFGNDSIRNAVLCSNSKMSPARVKITMPSE